MCYQRLRPIPGRFRLGKIESMRCRLLDSFAGPDSPHVTGECDYAERVTPILDASAVAGARPLDHEVQSDISWARTARIRRRVPLRPCSRRRADTIPGRPAGRLRRRLRAGPSRSRCSARLGTRRFRLDTIRPHGLGPRKRGQSLGAAHRMCPGHRRNERCGTVPIFASHAPPWIRTFIVQTDALPSRANLRSGRVIAELPDMDRRGEVAGKESDSGRDPATEFPGPCGHIDKVSCL